MAFAYTAAVAGAGTVTCTGTTTVTGTGTTFATLTGAAAGAAHARVGGQITVGANTRTIVKINSTTSLETDTAFPAFTAQAFTVRTGVVQTGTDKMDLNLGVITGFNVTNRGNLLRTFDARGCDLFINGTLTIDSTVAQLRNDGSCNNRFEVNGSVSGGEVIFNGRKTTANNGPFPYPGFDWLGTNGLKIMLLNSTNASYPAKFTVIDACVRFGADWLTTTANNFSRITTQGEECWILCASGVGTNQARIRQDNTTATIDFQATQTWIGVWLNFAVPQLSLAGYTPLNTDGPELNMGPVAVASRIVIENYNTTYVVPNYYAGAQVVMLGGGWLRLKNNLLGTNIAYHHGGGTNVIEFSKQVKVISKDAAGNLLSDGYFYFTPVGSNVAGVRPKGVTTDVTFDLSKKTIQLVDGAAETEFFYAWKGDATSGLRNTYNYFCTGTTKGAETHPAAVTCYGYDTQPITLALSGAGTYEATAVHTSLPTTDKVIANAAAITGVTFDFPTKVMDISGVLDPQLTYDAYQYKRNTVENLGVVDDCVISGTRTTYTGCTINIQSGGEMNASTTFKEIGAQDVNITTGGTITIPYRDADGLRVTVTGLDPQGFGITWHLRHRPTGGSTWTTVSGTGNTALILLAEGTYDVQVRAAGYEWESALVLNTAVSLSLNAGLRHHVSANNTPQHTMAFDASLEAIFAYDATAMKVSVVNSTSGILSPGFAELYQATQRIQHIPALVWSWTAPVTANATSQKILIPTGNPISMYLTDASTNTVKITCPVIHADTGISADDRVRGNASGYSIILGSPATAESAGLASQIISGLGGPGYDTSEHGLSIIKSDQDLTKAVIDLIKTAVDAIKPRTDLIPAAPAAVGSAMTLTGAYDAAKTAATQSSVDTLATATGTPLQASAYTAPANTDIAAIKAKTDTLVNTDTSALATAAQVTALATATGTPMQASAYTAPDNAGIAAIKAKTDTLPAQPASVGSAMTLTGAYDAAKTAATQSSVDAVGSDVVTMGGVVMDLPTLPEIEASTLAKTSDLIAVPAAVSAAVWNNAVRTLTDAPGLTTEQAEQLRKVAQLHGVGAQLVVTETTRRAGDVSQTITTTDDQTTVSAA